MYTPSSSQPHNGSIPASMLVILALLMTAAFFPGFGTNDIWIWQGWGENAFNNGLVEGYRLNQHEHPPGLTVLLWSACYLADFLRLPVFYGIKISFLPFLFASTFIIYGWSQRNLLATLFFHGIFSYTCLALCYIDIYITPFLLLAFYKFEKQKTAQGMLAFAIACLIKYPALIVLPFVLSFILFRATESESGKSRVMACIQAIMPACIMAGLVLLMFGHEPLYALQRAFQHNILSAQALNLNWIIGRYLLLFTHTPHMASSLDPATFMIADKQFPAVIKTGARGLFLLFYLLALVFFFRRSKSTENLLVFALLGHFAYFMFSIGVHENHLYLSCLLAMALFCCKPATLPIAIGICLISSINMFFFYGMDGHMPEIFPAHNPALDHYDLGADTWKNAGYPFDIRLLLAIFNLLYFFALWADVIKKKPDASS
ncbi:MAG TPA: hypothetical protein PLF22_03520 [Pseudomonadales bacterium]|nr:hypothetical protein [Pseudomonadales bacterium]